VRFMRVAFCQTGTTTRAAQADARRRY